jgi:hypothetical protein
MAYHLSGWLPPCQKNGLAIQLAVLNCPLKKKEANQNSSKLEKILGIYFNSFYPILLICQFPLAPFK